MATGGIPKLDMHNPDRHDTVRLTPAFQDALTSKRADLVKLIKLDDLWPYLRKYAVLTETTEKRFKVRNCL